MNKVTKSGEEFEIIFRQIKRDVPAHLYRGVHWYVEAWDGDVLFPRGTAYVCVGELGAFVDFIQVQDTCRGTGIGTMLIDAISERWPGAFETDGISEAGEKLADRLKFYRETTRQVQKKSSKPRPKKALGARK